MPRRLLHKLLVCSCFAALGGCQFLGNLHLTQRGPAAHSADTRLAAMPGTALQTGRDHLRAGRVGLAIDAYNLALASGEDPAAAYNGLGVAYARLGRSDAAYHFFRKAVMSDPLNAVYSHNLATLMDSRAFTLDQMERTAPAPVVAVAAAPQPRVTGKLYRDGNRQFSLTTLPADTGPDVRGTRTAAAANCLPQRAGRPAKRCAAAALPVTQSRNAVPARVAVKTAPPSAPVAVASAATPPDAPALTTAPAPVSAPAPATTPKGKRKTIELNSPAPTAPSSAPAAS